MATRSPTAFHGYWGNAYVTPADLPNVAASPTQSATLEVGDTAYVTGTQSLYFCIDATLGAAVWSPMSTGTGLTSANFDAFGRLRVSNPQTIFDSKLVYDAQPLYWSEELTNPGITSTYDQPNARVILSVAGASGQAIRQTRRFFNYQPGKSQLIFQTFNANGVESGVVKRIGYFDSTDGIFLELDGTTIIGSGLSFVRRSSGANPTDSVPQASWNLDTLDGSGGPSNPSGITFKANAAQILIIDLEWLGVGSARVGFVINGQIVYAHRFDCANLQQSVYMQSPNLPLRYELDAPGIASGTLDCICGTVISEGGQGATGTPFGFDSPRSANVANNASTTLLSIRHRAGSEQITIIPSNVAPLTAGNGASVWELLYNPIFPTPPAWSVSRGFCELDTPTVGVAAGQATPGSGTVIASGVFSNAAPAVPLDLRSTTLTLGVDVFGVSDVISLVVTNRSGGNEQYIATINWIALN